MIKDLIARTYNVLILVMLFPWMAGCNKDGASGGSYIDSSLLSDTGGSLFSSGSSGLTEGEAFTPLHAPEPATLILLGTGIWALHLLKRRAQ